MMESYKKFFELGVLGLTIFFVTNCARILPKPGLTFGAGEARWAEKMLNRMTLEEKVGQMIVCRYTGGFFNEDSDEIAGLKKLIVDLKIGGLIIFLGNAYETAYLNNALQKVAEIPLLIASDLERGAGNQITGATLFPTLMAVGATGSEDIAYNMGKITAQEGRLLGIHMTYAPVVDVNINPDNPIINTRAIGEDPEQVSRLAAAFIKGCQENGMIATAKHFPGHGDTDQDSHSMLPTINADLERLKTVELFPFQKAIDAGVLAIMSAHLSVPAFDPTPNLPSSLSPVILTELLRKQMGFKGIIVTDAMDMAGVTNSYSATEAALRSILAGTDMVLLPPEPAKVVSFLIEAAKSGQLSESRIDKSVRRILEAKARLGLHLNKLVDIEALPKKLGTKENLQQARLAFEAAATLVKNNGNVLPVGDLGKKIAVLSLSSDPGDYYAGRAFAEAIRRRSAAARIFYADADTGKEALDGAFADAMNSDLIVCAVFSSLRAQKGSVGLDPKHIDVINNLTGSDKPVIVVNFGSPYLLKNFPDIDAYLCLYRNTPQAHDVAARAIFGEMDIQGRLPVSLPGLFPLGHGIEIKKIK
jgi:beta-N-acetylhexosaminidase